MKRSLCLLLFLITGAVAYSQNPLIDGVNRTKTYEDEDDATYLELTDFSLTAADCELRYEYDGSFIDGYEAKDYEFSHALTVSYRKITSIMVYSDAIDIIADDIKTAVEGEDPFLAQSQKEEGLMTVYFSSMEDSKAAAAWLLQQVTACGGKAVIVE